VQAAKSFGKQIVDRYVEISIALKKIYQYSIIKELMKVKNGSAFCYN
jgi:hypothetical protein